jgi:hypothetical protein
MALSGLDYMIEAVGGCRRAAKREILYIQIVKSRKNRWSILNGLRSWGRGIQDQTFATAS